MFNKVLAAIDLSETSPQLVAEAIQLAIRNQAKLMLLHVISTEEELYLPYSLYPLMDGYSAFSETALGQHEARVNTHKKNCQKQLDAFQSQAISQGVDAETAIETGEAGHAICSALETWQGDLILLGHRGLTGIKEIVLGSVSNFVMHHASCSVLILRPQALENKNESFFSKSKEVTLR